MQKIEEFVASIQVVFEAAQHRTGNRDGILFFNSSHDHAQMLRFDDNSDALGADLVVDGVGDLHGETFLHLEPPCKHVHEPWNLAQANDFPIGNVCHMTLAEEREHVVFAKAENLDILHDHHFVVCDIEHGSIQQLVRILLVTAGQIPQ